MNRIDITTVTGTAVKVNSTTGFKNATLVRINADGTATVRALNGKSRKVKAFNVFLPR